MSLHEHFQNLTEPMLRRLAEELAFALRSGDTLALEGDLGAGKTTFARCLIRALAGNDGIEIPSPTFTLVQSYNTPRFEVAHYDLYRLSNPEELGELGLEHALSRGIALVEWPERAGDLLASERLTLALQDTGDETRRDVTLTATSTLAPRLERLAAMRQFLEQAQWGESGTRFSFLQGDASARRYARLQRADGACAILMDSPRQPDGPPVRDGKPYSQIAHLAEDVRPFVAIAEGLRARGLSTPQIFAHDLDAGLLLIEDLGDRVFGREVEQDADQKALWRRGVDTLVALRLMPPGPMPLPDGTSYALPPMDRGALHIEADLLLDWYWPALYGTPPSPSVRAEFEAIWGAIFERLDRLPKGWVLRDYHSPNLILLADRPAPRDAGIIDFQDALLGPQAYDLVSLLQDARLDVGADIERGLLQHYIAAVKKNEADFDEKAFRFSYAALGAERNTKILGIFARLAKRDGKRQYLAHIPRLWDYLQRNLVHEDLTALKAWYDVHLPPKVRGRALDI